MKKIFLILLLLPIIQSCFGDNNSNSTSDLTLKYVYPENGATYIPINHKFIIHFDQKIDRVRFLYYITLTRSDGTLVNCSVYDSLGSPNKTALLIPPMLDQGETYTLTIKKGIKSVSGGILKESQQFIFITASGTDISAGISNGKDITPSYQGLSKIEATKDVIKLYFVEHLNPLLIDKQSIYIRYKDGDNINSTPVYDFINRCIIITPDAPLESGEYEAVYYSGIEDLAGIGVGGLLYFLFDFTI